MTRDLTFSRWLRQVRSDRYATQEEALRALAEAGIAISQSEYSQWEGGSRTPRLTNPKRQALYGFFDSRPSDEVQGDAVVDAIRDLTEQMARIETRLEAVSGAMDGWADGLTALLAQLVAEHVAPQGGHAPLRAGKR